jgi:hypothetical protein
VLFMPKPVSIILASLLHSKNLAIDNFMDDFKFSICSYEHISVGTSKNFTSQK